MLEYILYLGIINIVFSLVWNFVFVLPISLLLALFKTGKGTYLLKAFGHYLLVSLIALLTLSMIQLNPGIGSLILFPLIGAFIVFEILGSNSYELQKQAAMEYDYEILSRLRFDGLFIIGAVILFIVTLFVPIIAVNPLTLWIFKVIDWAYNLKVIGWLLGIGGFLFLLSMIWKGILVSGMLIGAVVGKIKGGDREREQEQAEYATVPTSERDYIGNKKTLTFHRSDCYQAEQISYENVVWFESSADAIIQGYEPCKLCNPEFEQ